MHARTLVPALAVLLALGPASGSLVEDATGGAVTYQFDGDSHHDAPDDCDGASAEHLAALGDRTDGLLVPVEDEADHFLLPVDATTVGQRILVDATAAQVEYDVRIDVLVPGCLGSVLDPENQPAPPIRDPKPGDGERLVSAKDTDGGYACSDRWFWNLNQVGDHPVPASIHVAWTDGSQEDVPLQQTTPATVVHYATTAHPDATVERATAVMPDGWTGQFILSEGFCDAEDGGAVFGEPARRVGDAAVEFTPTVAGPHVVSVVFVAGEPEVPTAVPASCHQCVGGLEDPLEPVFYALGSALS